MRYFYTLGEFQKRTEIPKWSHHGWDVRSWTSSNVVKEVDKKTYKKIVVDDKRIVGEIEMRYGIKMKTFHKPFKEKDN